MHYNELKIRILSLFGSAGELNSLQVRRFLLEQDLVLSDKSVEMALMRYWRQGLLSRNRQTGMFQYKLTERGIARRDWLSKNK
jgi:DNA-binding transcriptional regulator PaaX